MTPTTFRALCESFGWAVCQESDPVALALWKLLVGGRALDRLDAHTWDQRCNP